MSNPSLSLDRGTGIDAGETAQPLLAIEGLKVAFRTDAGVARAVDGVSLNVKRGEILAVVGESGSGKSVTALSVMRLLPRRSAEIVAGRLLFEGRDLVGLEDEQMRHIRGRSISMIFQEPMTSLNPLLTIGEQVAEPLLVHMNMDAEQAQARATELLRQVGISDPKIRMRQYPHQMSGGMRQRVMIAIGLACNPKLIIADEPTTALDVTIQAQILELMKQLSEQLDIALIIITHNLGIVARYAHRVAVMYAGRVVEEGTSDEIFGAPQHPYTSALIRSVPRVDRPSREKLESIPGLPPSPLRPIQGCRFAPRCRIRGPVCENDPPLELTAAGSWARCFKPGQDMLAEDVRQAPDVAPAAGAPPPDPPLISVRGLTKVFGSDSAFQRGAAAVRAVDDVSFDIFAGETLGMVGESGCGKTTIGRMMLHLEEATGGSIRFEGKDVTRPGHRDLLAMRRKVQVIFQDPYSSLNPRMTIGQIVREPLHVHGIVERGRLDARVSELLENVGISAEMASRYPHQMSGGQRQRIGIARALAMEPKLIVCDEAVSALDVSIQGQIINLLMDLQKRLGVAYFFIAHDLAVVQHISTRVVVMYLGQIMESATRDELYRNPLHPYTRVLLDAAPVPDPAIERSRPVNLIKGELPSRTAPLKGCVFQSRCPMASEECRITKPPLRQISGGHHAACIKI